MPNPRLMIQDYAGVTVVTFNESSILDAAVITQLGQELYDLVDKQAKQKLILDFSNVKFLASQTLGVLLNLNKKASTIKGDVVLCGIRKELMKVFEITQLNKILKFYRDDAEALAAFKVFVK